MGKEKYVSDFIALTDREIDVAQKALEGNHLLLKKSFLNKVVIGVIGSILTLLVTIGWMAKDYDGRILPSVKVRDKTVALTEKNLITEEKAKQLDSEVLKKAMTSDVSIIKINKIQIDDIVRNQNDLKKGQRAIYNLLSNKKNK